MYMGDTRLRYLHFYKKVEKFNFDIYTGGHTTEMLSILSSFSDYQSKIEFVYVISQNDRLSLLKLKSTDKTIWIPRSRQGTFYFTFLKKIKIF